MKTSSITILILLAILATTCPIAVAEKLTVNDYDFNIDIEPRDFKILATGSVSGGEPCKRLRIDIFCRGDDGYLAQVVAWADNAGSGKRAIEGRRDLPYKAAREWRIDKIFTECISQ
jgi:hypothetical protein